MAHGHFMLDTQVYKYTHSGCVILMAFHRNICCTNTPQCYVDTYICLSCLFFLSVSYQPDIKRCVVSIPLCILINFFYLSRLYTSYSNRCKLLQLVNYATCFGLSAIIRLTHKCDLIKVHIGSHR